MELFVEKSKHLSRPSVWMVDMLLFVLGITLSGLVAYEHHQRDQQALQNALRERTDSIADESVERIANLQRGLRSVRSVVLTVGDDLTRSQFHRFNATRGFVHDFPGAQGLGFIRRVPGAQLDAFVRKLRERDDPQFMPHTLGDTIGDDRFIIQFVEPLEENRQAIGLDLTSEKNRREAAERSMASGETTLSGPIALVQVKAQQKNAFLLLMPVYREGIDPVEIDQRRSALIGWAYAPLSIPDVLLNLPPLVKALTLTVLDRSGEDIASVVFDTTEKPGDGPVLVSHAITRSVFGRTWEFRVTAHQAYVDSLPRTSAWVFFLVGSVISFLLMMLFSIWRKNQLRQEALREEQSRLATIVQYSSDAIIGELLDGRITFWNRAAQRLFGYSQDDVKGVMLKDLILPDGHQEDETMLLQRAARGELIPPFDAQRRKRDGELVDVSVTVGLIRSSHGEVVGIAKFLRNIAERKAHERELQSFNRHLDALVKERTAALEVARHDLEQVINAMPSMIGYWDKDLRNRVANHAYLEWFGERARGIYGRHISELLGPDLFAKNLPYLQAALRGEVQTFERDIPGPSGAVRHSLASYLPNVVNGEVMGFYVVVHDVTPIKQAQQEVSRLANLLGAVLRSSSEIAIIATDPAGEITVFNAGAERMLGWTANEVIGKRNLAQMHDSSELAQRGAQLATASGSSLGGFQVLTYTPDRQGSEVREWTCMRRDGTSFPASIVVTPMRDDKQAVMGYLAIAQDITERLRVTRLKDEFVSTISHELRTPMSALLGIGYLLEKTPLSTDQRQLLRKLQQAGNSLLSIINDVLDYSKIEAGRLEAEMHRFSLVDVLREAVELFAVQAKQKGLTLQLQMPDDLPAACLGDGNRFRQVLVNLLSNAVKFTATGRVTLTVDEWFRTSTDQMDLTVSVRDTGIGISDDVRSRIFEPFCQADASTTRRFGGTGLGLAISKRLVDMMGGEMGVDSVEGQGSRFWVRLAFGLSGDWHLDAPEPHTNAPLDIVLAMDEPPLGQSLVGVAERLGWSVQVLASSEAWRSVCDARRRQSQALPDVVIAARPDRSQASVDSPGSDCGGSPPLVLTVVGPNISGEAGNLPTGEARVTSPVSAAGLFNALNRLLQGLPDVRARLSRGTRWDAGELRALPGIRVLLVDDSDINLDVGKRLLETEGARVELARDGVQAITRLKDLEHPVDIVLMDVHMPGMDGLEATRKIRAELGLQKLPVLALTAGAHGEDSVRALAAGMNEFLSKPLQPVALFDAIHRWVEVSTGRPWPVEDALMVAPRTAADWPQIDGIDGAVAAKQLQNDVALFKRLLYNLLNEFQASAIPVECQSAKERSDLGEFMHKLAGSASTMGAHGVRQCAAQAERLLRQEKPDILAEMAALDAVRTGLVALARSSQGVVDALSKPAETEASLDGANGARAVAEFKRLLGVQDLEALPLFERLQGQLVQALGAEAVEFLKSALYKLDFAAALRVLLTARPGASSEVQ